MKLGNKETKPASAKPAVKKSGQKKLAGFWAKTYNLLFHEDVYYRIGGYLLFGLALFLVTWACFTFFLKKPNLVLNSFIVQKFFKSETLKTIGPWGAQTFGATWNLFGWKIQVAETFAVWGNVLLLTFKYFLNHLVFVFLFIFCLNLFKIGRWSFGLIYFGLYTILWGVAIGTNSMVFPVGNNPILGPLVLFARFGIWVWFSYLLIVVSTTQFAWLVAPNWLSWAWNKQRKIWPVSFSPDQREVFIYGLLFLLASSFAEARIFVHYNL